MLDPETDCLVVQLGQPIASLLARIGTPDGHGPVEYDPEFEGVSADGAEPGIWYRASKEFMLARRIALRTIAADFLLLCLTLAAALAVLYGVT